MSDDGAASVAPGTQIGHYLVIRGLGAGGMGEVFEARDTRLDRRVALKVIRRDLAADPARRKRLEREARTAAGLNHPNIVTLHSIDEHEGVHFLTMELVDGTTVRDVIPPQGLAVDRLLRIAVQLADALAAAHAAGIVHRDLKPANLMLTRSGVLKVLDFGLSESSGDGTSTTTAALSTDGLLVGTVPYMAPETLETGTADARSDIFSLGVVLFEMATGRRPFEAATPLATMNAILRDSPPLASDVNPRVPPTLAHLIDRCLAKSPSARRQSAADLRTDLEDLEKAIASGPGSGAVPAPWSPQPTRPYALRPRQAYRWLAGAGIAALMVLLALAFLRDRPMPVDRSPGTIRSLAILPLEDLTQGEGQAYFSEGMTEELITKVARIPQLQVAPRSSVMNYTDGRRSPLDIANELGVDALLEGSVFRSDGRVRISAHLIDPRTNRELWAESYEREVEDILALQSEVALAIAGQLQIAITPTDHARVVKWDHRVSPAAYDAYLRALAHLNRVNKADTEAAVRLLERAAALDPGAPDVLGALAAAYAQLYGSYAPEEASRLEPKARAAIDKGLALNPESAEAQYARGLLLWDGAHGWPHEEAVAAYRAAIALKPTLDPARRSLAVVLNHLGLPEAALQQLALPDESPAVLMQRGLAYRIQGNPDRALSSWLAIPAEARNTTHLGHIAWALAELGRTEEAWTMLDSPVTAAMEDVNGMLSAARALLLAGRGSRPHALDAIAVATTKVVDTRESHHTTYLVALANARLGRPDEALRWLRFTAANGFPCYPLMAGDRSLDSLRTYAPFVEFLAELKIRWESYGARLGEAGASRDARSRRTTRP